MLVGDWLRQPTKNLYCFEKVEHFRTKRRGKWTRKDKDYDEDVQVEDEVVDEEQKDAKQTRELQLNLKFKKPTLRAPNLEPRTERVAGRPSMSMSCCWTLAKNALAVAAEEK